MQAISLIDAYFIGTLMVVVPLILLAMLAWSFHASRWWIRRTAFIWFRVMVRGDTLPIARMRWTSRMLYAATIARYPEEAKRWRDPVIPDLPTQAPSMKIGIGRGDVNVSGIPITEPNQRDPFAHVGMIDMDGKMSPDWFSADDLGMSRKQRPDPVDVDRAVRAFHGKRSDEPSKGQS